MDAGPNPSRRRCLTVWVTVTALGAVLLDACARLLLGPSPAGTSSSEDVLLRGAAVAVLVCLPPVWWAATHTCWQVARGPLAAAPRGFVRRLVLLACGGAIVVGGLTPAQAATPEGRDTTSRQGLHGLPLPQRAALPERDPGPVTASGRATRRARTSSSSDRTGGHHVVRRGESLWSIAADRLGSAATGSDIDSLWRRIHDLNTETVQDPDLIHPGQSLRLPPGTPAQPPVARHHEGERP